MQVLDGFQNILAIAQEKDSQGTAGIGSGEVGRWGVGERSLDGSAINSAIMSTPSVLARGGTILGLLA
jgi:hypothetical protein